MSSGETPARAHGGVGVAVSELSFMFNRGTDQEVSVFDRITLDVRPAEIVALVGKSGCGKSTLLNILAGLLAPQLGEIEYYSETPEPSVRLGYITQEDRLMPWRSAIRNVELPLEIAGVPRAERRAVASDLLKRVGLHGAERRRPSELSGGMRQRAAIARALSIEPELLLMDEPFGALDVWTRNSLHELLMELHRERSTTLIIVTHDVFEAITLADRVVTLAPDPGRIINEYVLPPNETGAPRPLPSLYQSELFDTFLAIRNDLSMENS